MVDELADDARVIAGATAGPWEDSGRYGAVVTKAFSIMPNEPSEAYGGVPICESAKKHDRVFIARARMRYPELVAEVRELRKQKMAAEAALARLLSCTHGDKDRCGCRLPAIEYFNALPSVSSEAP